MNNTKYKYYKNGHYKTFNKNYNWDNGNVTEKEYNKKNELICEKYIDRGFTKNCINVKIKILYEYKNGEVIKRRVFENNKELCPQESESERKYDEKQRLIEEKVMYGNEVNYFKKIQYSFSLVYTSDNYCLKNNYYSLF